MDSGERIMSGRTWADFCDALKRAGDVILRDGSPQDPFDRAEGFRYLSRLTRVALESYIEFADPLAPVLRRPAHETVKIGADNPDNYYQSAAISGQHAYRIWGTRGTVHYLGFGTYAGNYGSAARSGQTGYLEGRDLQIAPDGSFEIIVSCDQRPGNWLRMEPDTASLIVRQTFWDRQTEHIADLHIERLGAEGPPPPITAESIDRGLAAASAYVAGTATLFADWAEGFAQAEESISCIRSTPPLPPRRTAIRTSSTSTATGSWARTRPWSSRSRRRLASTGTSSSTITGWSRSTIATTRIAVNHHGAKYRDDGSVRLVVAHENPGADNWIDTAGHRRGTMCWRWIRADAHPQPSARVVKRMAL